MNRTLATIALSFSLIVALGTIIPRSNQALIQSKVSADRFWTQKTFKAPHYTMILLGDSRIYRGVSPKILEAQLPGTHILNFGYSSGGLNNLIINEARNKLSPNATPPVIVLGLSPSSLTEKSNSNKHFIQEKKRSIDDRFLRLYLAPLRQFLTPPSKSGILEFFGRAQIRSQYHQKFHNDGWVESNKEPSDPDELLPHYREVFQNRKISPARLATLLKVIKDLTSEGVQVFAFRPPTTNEMEQIENELSGYNEKEISAAVQQNGGTWLKFPKGKYTTYDGSHLDGAAARLFSQDLAEQLHRSLQLASTH